VSGKEGGICFHRGRLFVSGTRELVSSSNTAELDTSSQIRWSALSGEQDSAFISGSNYWRSLAKANVFPGVGGSRITAMTSAGSELLIFKDRGAFALRGEVRSDGVDAGHRIDVVAEGPGAEFGSSVVATANGVFFANEEGAYWYRGGQVTNLTRGRVQRAWDYYASCYRMVSCAGSRVFFNSGTTAMVYDFELDGWTVAVSENDCGNVVRVYSSEDTLYGDLCVGETSSSGYVEDWNFDYENTYYRDRSNSATTRPNMTLVLPPMQIADDPVSMARADTLFVHAMVEDTQGNNPTLTAKVRHGFFDYKDPHYESGTALTYAVAENASYPTVTRLPIEGFERACWAQVELNQSAASEDIRLYAVGLLSRDSRTVGA
jgi:hypothetical protein